MSEIFSLALLMYVRRVIFSPLQQVVVTFNAFFIPRSLKDFNPAAIEKLLRSLAMFQE